MPSVTSMATCAAPLAVQADGTSCCPPTATSIGEKRTSSEGPREVDDDDANAKGTTAEGKAVGCWKRQKFSDSNAGGQPAQAEYTYQHRQLQAEERGEKVPEADTVWVQCEICSKWRPMPVGHKVKRCNP